MTGWKDSPPRLFAGTSFGRSSGRLKLAIVQCRGEGWQLRCVATHAITMPGNEEPSSAICNALQTVCERAELSPEQIDVIGLTGLVDSQESRVAAIIAGQTGITTVTGFHHQDIAFGGTGRPLTPVPAWFLHRSKLGRLVLDLGPTLRVMYFPPGGKPEDVFCFDAGPCCSFLDQLTSELSRGRYAFDPSGHFAVQGTSCESLINKWLSHPFLLKVPPRFLSEEEMSEGFVRDSVAFAREMKLSAPDVLCSANHFVARCLQEAVHRFLATVIIDEVRVCGGGSWNGLLWKLVCEVFGNKPIIRCDEVGIPSDARRAIYAALLGYCAIEHLPANLPAITGACRRRVLGQITPGAEANWDRCVINLAERFDVHHAA